MRGREAGPRELEGGNTGLTTSSLKRRNWTMYKFVTINHSFFALISNITSGFFFSLLRPLR